MRSSRLAELAVRKPDQVIVAPRLRPRTRAEFSSHVNRLSAAFRALARMIHHCSIIELPQVPGRGYARTLTAARISFASLQQRLAEV